MERVWIEPPAIEISDRLQKAVGGHRLVTATLTRRGYGRIEQALAFLDPECYDPTPPEEIPNLIPAVIRLERSISRGERICIWGDFDVDGQTSTALLVEALREMGADVIYYIPIREIESHGVHIPSLKQQIAKGTRLLLTCDTGVTAHEAISYARTNGVEVIITDHHDLPEALPDAHAVVNPKMLPAEHPLYGMPGVGAAYKLVEALSERAGHREWANRSLDLVALGIVADLADLRDDVRYQLQHGLGVLRQTPRLGLKIMMELAQVRAELLSEEDIAFSLAPRMNALGRLADANVSVEFLTSDDLTRVRILANEMEGLNARRKLLLDQVAQAAQGLIDADPSLLDQLALVLAHPGWPAGVVGLVASRLAKKYHRPTVILTIPEVGHARGSARSIEGIDISAAIAAHREMLTGFGGHPMAAGLAIEANRIQEFQYALSETVERMFSEIDTRPRVQIDGYVPLSEISVDFVEDLNRLAPYGPGNPRLTLVTRDLSIKSSREIGRGDEHLLLIVEDQERATQKVLWWDGVGESIPEGRFDLAFHVDIDRYEAQREVRLTWVDSRPLAIDMITLPTKARPLRIVDWRGEKADRVAELKEEGVQAWIEGEVEFEIEGRNRYTLEPSKELIIWTTPPGPEEIRIVLERVSPEVVYLFAEDPEPSDLRSFLTHLAGMIKYALRVEGGKIQISTLTAATAQREITVRRGIELLCARGDIEVLNEANNEMTVASGSGARGDESGAEKTVRELLAETAAYRAFYHHANVETLLPY